MSTTKIQLEAGKRYVRRGGEISGVIEPSGDPEFPWRDKDKYLSYTDSGRWFGDNPTAEHVLDLIEEYEEPRDVPEPDAPADDTDEVGYRILEPDELVQEGDEVLLHNGIWTYSWKAGKCQSADLKYRRPLKADETEELTEADVESDGWIEWSGGECPVDGGVWLEGKLRNGDTGTDTAREIDWHHSGSPGDIVAYREARAEQPKKIETTVFPPSVNENPVTLEQLAQPAEPEKQPQPGWVINQFNDIGWRTVGPVGAVVMDEDWDKYPTAYDSESDYVWKDLPDCTGFDYEVPPEQTPAEKRLGDLGLEEDGGDYLKPTGTSGVKDGISRHEWTATELEAIAAHMREREGGAA